jgi:hypothetical protein
MWKCRLTVKVERHVRFHALNLWWTAILVIAAVVVGAAIEIARPFVLVRTAVLCAHG